MRLFIVPVAALLAACGGSSGGGNKAAAVQVSLVASGVSPASVNVGSGGQVHFVNNDTAPHQIASTSCTELVSPSLAAGKDFTAPIGTGPKTCTYDDGLNPSAAAFAGTINVAAPSAPGY